MQHERACPRARCRRSAAIIAAGALVILLSACADTSPSRDDTRNRDTTPAVDSATLSATLLAAHLEMLQKLMQSPPAEQAEIMVGVQRDYELAPTPSHELRYALALATPGQAGINLVKAQQLLRELLAVPEPLTPAERAFAYLELQKADTELTLAAENRALQDSTAHADRERLAATNRKLQIEIDENARLRKELDDAQAKLDAIANIERSLEKRKPNPEGQTP